MGKDYDLNWLPRSYTTTRKCVVRTIVHPSDHAVFDVRVMLFLFKSSVGRSTEQSKPGVAVVRYTVVQMAQRDRRTGAAGQPRMVGRGSVPESQTVRGGNTPGNALSPEANSGHGPTEIVTRYGPVMWSRWNVVPRHLPYAVYAADVSDERNKPVQIETRAVFRVIYRRFVNRSIRSYVSCTRKHKTFDRCVDVGHHVQIKARHLYSYQTANTWPSASACCVIFAYRETRGPFLKNCNDFFFAFLFVMLARPLRGTDLGGTIQMVKGRHTGIFPVRAWLSVVEATSVVVVQ